MIYLTIPLIARLNLCDSPLSYGLISLSAISVLEDGTRIANHLRSYILTKERRQAAVGATWRAHVARTDTHNSKSTH
jgi:hypothetical protein